MAETDENIFPEEGFPVGGEEPAPPELEEQKTEETDTPWLKFIENYPQYMSEPLPEGLTEAVTRGEDPTEAYLRIENQRLNEKLKLLRIEKLLRNASVGAAKSTGAESPEDEFTAGLMYEG